jgi:hypothetical protein
MKRQPNTEQDQKIQPCHHMETLVSCLSDNSLSGPARWYTRFHVLYCSKCRMALKALRALRDRLSDLGNKESSIGVSALTGERRTALEQALDEVDRQEI